MLRPEEEIRERLAELNELQGNFEWTDGERAVHSKTTLRAQMKGLMYSLGEGEDFKIVEGQ